MAGIDHTYESDATAFPDGRVTTCLAREAPRSGRGEKVVAGRAADVSFVLEELTGAHPAWPGAGLIDPSRMAMAGHSAGGQATIVAGPAVTTLPRGHVLFPRRLKPAHSTPAKAGTRRRAVHGQPRPHPGRFPCGAGVRGLAAPPKKMTDRRESLADRPVRNRQDPEVKPGFYHRSGIGSAVRL